MRYTITNEIKPVASVWSDLGFIDDGEARGVAYDLMRSGLARHAEVHPPTNHCWCALTLPGEEVLALSRPLICSDCPAKTRPV